MTIEAATVVDDGGACSLAASIIFLEMISKPVMTGTPIEGMTPRADGKESASTTRESALTMWDAMAGDTTTGE